MRPILLAVLLLAAVSVYAEESDWRKLPYPPGRAETVSGIALDGDTLWAMFQNVAYWDGKKWHKPTGPALRGGMYLTKFLGGGSQPLYCTQPSGRDNVGKLFKLSDGVAEPVLEFPFDRSTDPPGIFISRQGTILNFTEGKFSIFDDSQWIDHPIPEKEPHLLFDRGEKVDLYYPVARKLFTVGPRNQVTERELELPLDPKTDIQGARWGDRSALIFGRWSKKTPITLDLKTGEMAPAKVPALTYQAALALRDGATLLLAHSAEKGLHLCRFGPQGDFAEVPGTRGIRWNTEQFRSSSVVEGKGGELWLGGTGLALARVANLTHSPKPESDANDAERSDASLQLFGPETGFDLTHCRTLVIDSRQNLYAANYRAIYGRFITDPPEDLIPPRTPESLGQAVWHWKPDQAQIKAAWNAGDSLILASSDGRVTSLSAKGDVLFQTRVEGDQIQPPCMVSSDDKQIRFGSIQGVLSLDAESGKPRDLLPVLFDLRIAPVPIERGYLIVPRGRSPAIVGVDHHGEQLWKAKLPGYVMAHPTKHGSLAIVQTRSGSYGGQATVCIDTREGTILWQDVTDAYGVGVAFSRSGELVVEADQKMSPELTNGWLICREAATGNRLWEYRVDGLIHHPPLVDASGEFVFAVFSRGEVVCLNIRDGELVWKRQLPENAFEGVNPSYDAAWSPHSIQGDHLHVVDCNHVLHVIQRSSGKVDAEVLLNPSPQEKPIGSPRLVGDLLIVPLTTGVAAYRWTPRTP